jgi:hypothetical protein
MSVSPRSDNEELEQQVLRYMVRGVENVFLLRKEQCILDSKWQPWNMRITVRVLHFERGNHVMLGKKGNEAITSFHPRTIGKSLTVAMTFAFSRMVNKGFGDIAFRLSRRVSIMRPDYQEPGCQGLYIRYKIK